MSAKLMRHQQRKFSQNGQSLIEMALMLPILLVLIITAVEVGRLFFTKTVITNAAREGAYYLSRHPEDFDPYTVTAPNTVLAARAEASNSGIPEITVNIAAVTISSAAGGEDEGGGEESGGYWWSGEGGWGWDGGCNPDDIDESGDLESVRVTVQTNVPNILFLGFIGNIFSLDSANYSEFPISSCVEMLVP